MRFLSVDPLTSSYPYYTPYQFAGNKPIIAVDLDGLEEKIVINSTYKAAPTLLYNQNGELQEVPNYYTVTQELSKDHVMYSTYANNEKYGTEGTLTLNYNESEKVAEDYNSGQIDKFIDKAIKVSEFVDNVGDAIEFAGFSAVPLTEGASLPVAAVGAVIGKTGAIAKNAFKLLEKGNTKKDLLGLTIDVTFEALPAPLEESIHASKFDKLTKNVLEAEIGKVALVAKQAAENVIEEKCDEENDKK